MDVSSQFESAIRASQDEATFERANQELPPDGRVVLRMLAGRCSVAEMVYVLAWYVDDTDPQTPSANAALRAQRRLLELLPLIRAALDVPGQ